MSDHHSSPTGSDRPLVAAIVLAALLYGAALTWPQTRELLTASSHAAVDHVPVDHAADDAHGGHAVDAHAAHPAPPIYAVAPFVLLLGAIAVLPLISRTEHWWESNLHRFYVAAGLAALTLGFYLVREGASGVWLTLDHAILREYIPFIVLLFTLYTICGGIRIAGDLPAHPATNTMFIGVGGLIASFIGTTGAAMLLIRPLLETNSERRQVRHTIIFFIFVVCNCGGLLLPIGDPPLFLGYLRGVPFTWTLQLVPEWLMVNGLLLLVYYLWDRLWCYPHEKKADVQYDETATRRLTFAGIWPNALLLAGVVLSVALLDPSKAFPGTNWHAPLYLREMVQLGLIATSLVLGSQQIRVQNRFNYHAIVEVAALFLGIFICMQPALQILNVHGGSLGIDTPQKFFWATGGLSAFLDNAPTYVVFMETAKVLPAGESVAQISLNEGAISHNLLVAISLGAVFMGAMTYIGNGPNFMVKAIAEKSGIRMPSFFGYMLYSCAVLLPILALTSWIFLTLLRTPA